MTHKKKPFTLARLYQILYPSPRARPRSEIQAVPARIAQVSRLLSRAHALPHVPQSPLDRQRLGGQLFERAPEFVDAVSEALLHDPAALPAAPYSGEEIAARQAAADAWRGHAAHLFGLAFAAQKTYLHEQAEAVAMSRASLDEARARLSRPIPGGERRRLAELLRLPLLILDQVHGERASTRAQGGPPQDPAPVGKKGKRSPAASTEAKASFWAGFVHAGLEMLRQFTPAPPATGPGPAKAPADDGAPCAAPAEQGGGADILARFLSHHLGDRGAASAQGGPRAPSLRECMAAYEIMVANMDDTAPLDEETRAYVRPHQNEMAPELLDECAAGLREFPEIGASQGVPPDALLALAGQGTAIGGVVRAWERCHEGADISVLLLVEEAELAMDEIEDALRAYLNSGDMTPGGWSALANIFGEAIRLRQQIAAERRLGASTPPGKTRWRGGSAREQTDRADQVARFLAAVERGVVWSDLD